MLTSLLDIKLKTEEGSAVPEQKKRRQALGETMYGQVLQQNSEEEVDYESKEDKEEDTSNDDNELDLSETQNQSSLTSTGFPPVESKPLFSQDLDDDGPIRVKRTISSMAQAIQESYQSSDDVEDNWDSLNSFDLQEDLNDQQYQEQRQEVDQLKKQLQELD